MPADPGWPERVAGGRGDSQNLLHGVDQPLPAGKALRGTSRPDSRRIERHRYAAIQLARAFGATGIRNRGIGGEVRRLRTDRRPGCINYRAADFVGEIRALTGGAGVNVVLDIIAGSYVPRNLDVLALEGRLVQIGVLGGPKTEINVSVIMQKRLTVTGSTLRARPDCRQSRHCFGRAQNVWPLLESGVVKPDRARHLPDARRRGRAPAAWSRASTSARSVTGERRNRVIG